MTETMVAESLKVEVKRVIRADRSKIFAAWTNPEVLKKWFGPGTMVVAIAETDPRVGGNYRIEMQRIEERTAEMHLSDRSTARGVYEEIVEDELLSFTWRGDWASEEETLVTVRFKDVSGGTEVTLTHERFATAASRDGHAKGWEGALAKLSTLLEA